MVCIYLAGSCMWAWVRLCDIYFLFSKISQYNCTATFLSLLFRFFPLLLQMCIPLDRRKLLGSLSSFFLFQFECEFYLYRFIYICMRCGSIFLLSLILLGFTHLSSTATWKMCHYQFHWLLITHTHYYHISFPAIVFFEQRFCNE